MLLSQWEKEFFGFLNTPQIFSGNDIFGYANFKTTAEVLPQATADLTAPSTGVLGKRMEHYFSYYIRKFTELEVLAENEQIIEENLTLGELDFLLKDYISGKTFHVELVYKFYLYDSTSGGTEIQRWVGPNRRDSLYKKLNRLQKRQFPLLFSEATRPLLEKFSVSTREVIQKVCFKANLFLPLSEENRIPDNVNQEAIAGYYIPVRDFSPDRFGRSVFFSPPKPKWPISPHFQEVWFSYSEILKKIDPLLESKRSPLLWMKTSGGKFKKFFIVWW